MNYVLYLKYYYFELDNIQNQFIKLLQLIDEIYYENNETVINEKNLHFGKLIIFLFSFDNENFIILIDIFIRKHTAE